MTASSARNGTGILKWLAAVAVLTGLFYFLLGALPAPQSAAQGNCQLAQAEDCQTPPLPSGEANPRPGAPPVEDAPVYRFAAIGDWGAGTPFQRDVAAQMAKAYQETPFKQVITLGDNIYPDGNINKHGEVYFKQTYKPLLDAGVHFVVSLGNHDTLRGFHKDQIQYFKMPGAYYTFYPSAKDVEFFILNTNSFARDEVQQQWLKKKLSDSEARWKIVVGHHPLYSSGEHGNHPALQAKLEPLMAEYGVALYLAGHDHNYERFRPVKGVTHVISGGAGAYLRDFEKIQPGSVKREKRNHFLLFEIQGQTLRMQAIDKLGNVFDTLQLTRQKQPQALPEAS